MSRLFWRIPITRYTCDIHGVPVVWRATPSYINPEWISQSVIGVKENSYTKILQFTRNHRNGAHSWVPLLPTLMTSTWLKISWTGWADNFEAICEFRSWHHSSSWYHNLNYTYRQNYLFMNIPRKKNKKTPKLFHWVTISEFSKIQFRNCSFIRTKYFFDISFAWWKTNKFAVRLSRDYENAWQLSSLLHSPARMLIFSSSFSFKNAPFKLALFPRILCLRRFWESSTSRY